MTRNFASVFIKYTISIHTLLAKGDSVLPINPYHVLSISIHTLLAKGDCRLCYPLWWAMEFQSTPFSRRVTRKLQPCWSHSWFQSTPFSRRVTNYCNSCHSCNSISIHTLLAKGDYFQLLDIHFGVNFNPHPSREGWRISSYSFNPSLVFQSTPFSRRVTKHDLSSLRFHSFQSTPFSRRVTLAGCKCSIALQISIHTLLAKGDLLRHRRDWKNVYFNPHPSREGWPRPTNKQYGYVLISIHTLLAVSYTHLSISSLPPLP